MVRKTTKKELREVVKTIRQYGNRMMESLAEKEVTWIPENTKGRSIESYLRHLLNSEAYWYKMIKDDVFKLPPSIIGPFSQITEALSEIWYYSATQFTNPSRCPISFEIEKEGKIRRAFGESVHTRFLINLYNSKYEDSMRYTRFFDIVGPNGIGLVDNIEFKEMQTSSIEHTVRSGGEVIPRKKEKNLIIPQFHIGKNALSPNQLSEGTLKRLL